jgi:hypothetical protein
LRKEDIWKDSEELWSLWQNIAQLDTTSVNNILNSSEEADQLLTISAVTLATAVASSFSPFGQFITSKLVSIWESVLAKIAEILGRGINWTIQSINIPSQPLILNPAAPAMPSVPDSKTLWEEVVDIAEDVGDAIGGFFGGLFG